MQISRKSPPAVRSLIALSAALMSLTAAPAAHADKYDFTILPANSAAEIHMWTAAPLGGTWIGDYDAATNPGGTRTMPGLFGGSGNNPIPFGAAAVASIDSTTHPVGSFKADIDTELGVILLTDLAADVMNASEIGMDFTLNLAWDTFHTASPTAFFIGGINLPLPLGAAALTTLNLQQTSVPGVGVLTPVSENVYDFTVGVLVDLSLEAAYNGASIGSTSVPVPIVLGGSLFIDPVTRSATLVSFQVITVSEELPLTFELPANIPLPLPTLLPPGQTANLLASPTFDGITIDLVAGLTLVAWGKQPCPCDLNNDSQATLEDFFLFFNAFDVNDPLADINDDGQVTLEDFFAFFESLDRGCN